MKSPFELIAARGEVAVSVIMPVHNAGDYLREAVDSILGQSHRTLELVIINDNSSDDSLRQLSRFSSDRRLRIHNSPGNGIIDALNFGIEISKFDVIARMDGDDISHPDRLKDQINFWRLNPNLNVIATKVSMFKSHEQIGEGYATYEKWINQLTHHKDIEREFFIESPLAHPSVMLCKSDLCSLGGYQDNGWPEDYDLWCRALLAGMKFGKPNGSALLYWRDHENRASRTQSRYVKDEFLKCKAMYLAQYLRKYSRGKKVSIWGAGRTGLKLFDYLSNNSVDVIGFIDIDPRLHGKTKRNRPVEVLDSTANQDLELLKQSFCIIAVASRGARDKIRRFLCERSLSEGVDFVLAA